MESSGTKGSPAEPAAATKPKGSAFLKRVKGFILFRFYALRAIWGTLWKAGPTWTVVLSIFLPRIFPWFLDETQLTRLGAAYEVIGIFCVAQGISSKMEIGGHNLRKKILAWFKELWGNTWYFIRGPKRVYANLHGTARGNATVSASVLRADFKLPPVTLEEQVKALEGEINGLKKLITAVEKNARMKIASLETLIQKQREELAGQVKESQLSLKSALAGDYKLEFVGLFLTLVGLVYSTIPNDIIRMFGR